MLERALGHIHDGFYIDVGAWHPDIDSVTRHFYDKGWSGLNIEPGRQYLDLFVKKRARDTNLNVALGEERGRIELHHAQDSGLSSTLPRARALAEDHGFMVTSYEVELLTLSEVCERHCAGRDIHFLKIDVEGMEPQVIRGADWQRFRPWVVLVESTEPCTQRPAWADWEPILLAADYRFAWFDGLNRFYVRRESSDLLRHFEVPPNVFDQFVPARMHDMQEKLAGFEGSRCTRQAAKICARLRSLFAGLKAMIGRQSAS